MKKHILLIVLLLSNIVYSQVGIGTASPNVSAILDLTSNSKGLLVPRMTTIERNAITSPANSLTIFNTNEQCFNYYDLPSTTWKSLCANGGSATIPTLRIGLNTQTYGSTTTTTALRFNNNNSAAEMLDNSAGAPNYINTIPGLVMEESYVWTTNGTGILGQTTNARTTDRIKLPVGIYRVTLQHSGAFTGTSPGNYYMTYMALNNQWYCSLTSGHSPGPSSTGGSGTTILTLTADSYIDFLTYVQIGQAFQGPSTVTGGRNYGSTITIEKLQ